MTQNFDALDSSYARKGNDIPAESVHGSASVAPGVVLLIIVSLSHIGTQLF